MGEPQPQGAAGHEWRDRLRRWLVGGRGQTYFYLAILDSRSTLHLAYRLVVRFAMFVDRPGHASGGAGFRHWVLPLFALLDVAMWWILRRDSRFHLGWRLPLDALDIVFWSLSPLPPSGNYDTAVFVSVPLAVESGFRLGTRGLVVPACILLIVGAIRSVADVPLLPFTFAWLVLGVGIGMALYLYCQRLHAEAERERSRIRSADAQRAYLAGQNSVAMGASSIVDAIEGVVPVLGHPRRGSALWELAGGWKARLGASTRATATYLQVALLEWERDHNEHPDLSSHVFLQLQEGAGTILLTGPQVSFLHSALNELSLSRTVRVEPTGADSARLPGGSIELKVGDRVVRVPADPDEAQRPVDPAPVAFLMIAAQNVPNAFPGGPNMPVPVVVAIMLLCLGAGWWSHRELLARGAGARPAILGVAVGIAVVTNIAATLTVRSPANPDGGTPYPLVGLMLLAYVGGFYWCNVSRRHLALLVGGFVVTAVTCLVLFPGPTNLRSFAVLLALNMGPFPATCHISRSLSRAAQRHAAVAREEDRAARVASFRRGRESVMRLVRRARDDACDQLRVLAPRLDPALSSLVSRRLDDVDRRLLEMRDAGRTPGSVGEV